MVPPMLASMRLDYPTHIPSISPDTSSRMKYANQSERLWRDSASEAFARAQLQLPMARAANSLGFPPGPPHARRQ
jgi:hypothetical protein